MRTAPYERSLRLAAALLVGSSLWIWLAAGLRAQSRFSLRGSWTGAVWTRERFQDALVDRPDANPNATDAMLIQYVRLGGTLAPTDRNGGSISFYLSSRWRRTLTDVPRVYPAGRNLRLYQGYVDVAGSSERRLRLRLGRQYLPNTAGFWQMDGVSVRTRVGRLAAVAYGGVGGPIWDSNGMDAGLIGGQVQARIGAGIVTRFGALISLRGLAAEDVETLTLTAGFDAGDSAFIHRPRGFFRALSADIAYEPLFARIARATIRGHAGYGLVTVRASVRYDIPQFPPDSIFRVFAFEATRQGTLSIEARPRPWLQVSARHLEQRFDDGPARRERLEVCVYQGIEPIAVAGLETLNWAGATRHYLYFRVQKRLTRYLSLAAGNALNTYRLLGAENDSFSRALQAEVELRPHPNWSAFVRVEQNTNPDYARARRVFGYLRASFAARTGGGS